MSDTEIPYGPVGNMVAAARVESGIFFGKTFGFESVNLSGTGIRDFTLGSNNHVGVKDRVILVTPTALSDTATYVTIVEGDESTFQVRTFNDAGTLNTRSFHVAVFRKYAQ